MFTHNLRGQRNHCWYHLEEKSIYGKGRREGGEGGEEREGEREERRGERERREEEEKRQRETR